MWIAIFAQQTQPINTQEFYFWDEPYYTLLLREGTFLTPIVVCLWAYEPHIYLYSFIIMCYETG